MADWTDEEYSAMVSGSAAHGSPRVVVGAGEASSSVLDTSDLKDSVDWRKEGAVTRPQAQGRCGARWAFVVSAALEALVKQKYGVLAELSA